MSKASVATSPSPITLTGDAGGPHAISPSGPNAPLHATSHSCLCSPPTVTFPTGPIAPPIALPSATYPSALPMHEHTHAVTYSRTPIHTCIAAAALAAIAPTLVVGGKISFGR